MKRLILVAVTTIFMLSLSACGDVSEKKVDTNAQKEMEQSKIKLQHANKDLNGELSDKATKTKPVVNDNNGVGIVTPTSNEPAINTNEQ